jgi:hypothetical protein
VLSKPVREIIRRALSYHPVGETHVDVIGNVKSGCQFVVTENN